MKQGFIIYSYCASNSDSVLRGKMKDEAEITGFIGHDYIDQFKSSVFCNSMWDRKLGTGGQQEGT